MTKSTLTLLIFLSFFWPVSISASKKTAMLPAIYMLLSGVEDSVIVAGDGSGDFNCDGVKDQLEINQALNRVAGDTNLTTVYLKGPMTCEIEEPIVISSNTKLTGDANVRVQLKDHTAWPYNKPLIRQKGVEHWNGSLENQIYGTMNDSISNVEIGGFELTAGTQDASHGSWAYILMIFYSASDLTVHDMHLHESYGDIIRVMSPGEERLNTNMKFYNNRMEYSGHEGLYLGYASDLEVYDNEIYTTRTNCGIRLSESRRVSIHGNTIGNSLSRTPSGYAGIYIENSDRLLESAEIYGNYIFGKTVGIVLEAGRSGDEKDVQNGVHIHHNKIYKIAHYTAGDDEDLKELLHGGIRIYGSHNTLIEFNTIEGSATDGIVFDMGTHTGTGYQTIVRNNIISNTVAGYALDNMDSSEHTFISSYNNFYNNAADYNNASSSTDIHSDPLYAAPAGTNPDRS